MIMADALFHVIHHWDGVSTNFYTEVVEEVVSMSLGGLLGPSWLAENKERQGKGQNSASIQCHMSFDHCEWPLLQGFSYAAVLAVF